MKISYNWIKDYLKIDIEPSKVAKILTGIGLEIEGNKRSGFIHLLIFKT